MEKSPRMMIRKAPRPPAAAKKRVMLPANVSIPSDRLSSQDENWSAAVVARLMAVTPAAETTTSVASDRARSLTGEPL